MRRVVRIAFRIVLFSLVALPPTLLVLALDSTPLVIGKSGVQFADVQQARHVLKRYDPRAMSRDQVTFVTSSEAELSDGLAAGLARVDFVSGRIAVIPSGAILEATVELPIPQTPLGRFVNLRAAVATSSSGLEVSHLSIGDVTIPAGLVRPSFILVVDYLVGDGKGEEILNSVRSVEVKGDLLTVGLQPPPTLLADISAAARQTLNPSDTETITVYYRRLVELGETHAGPQSVSLSEFTAPLFQLAAERSQASDPGEENTAAILALLVYFGTRQAERVLGDVTPADLDAIPVDTQHVKLEGRHDWVQHFVISAGLAVLGGRGLADLIGEAKEIQDTEGPSGFSFTDIAADRAGVRFALVARRSSWSARNVQDQMSQEPLEAIFFPRVGDLPEGLTERAFRSRYGDIDAPAYASILTEIDGRIGAIPIYE